jgi:hypothetical protein
VTRRGARCTCGADGMPPGLHEPGCGLPEIESDQPHYTLAHDPQARRSFGAGLAPWHAKCRCGWVAWAATRAVAEQRAEEHAQAVAA